MAKEKVEPKVLISQMLVIVFSDQLPTNTSCAVYSHQSSELFQLMDWPRKISWIWFTWFIQWSDERQSGCFDWHISNSKVWEHLTRLSCICRPSYHDMSTSGPLLRPPFIISKISCRKSRFFFWEIVCGTANILLAKLEIHFVKTGGNPNYHRKWQASNETPPRAC